MSKREKIERLEEDLDREVERRKEIEDIAFQWQNAAMQLNELVKRLQAQNVQLTHAVRQLQLTTLAAPPAAGPN